MGKLNKEWKNAFINTNYDFISWLYANIHIFSTLLLILHSTSGKKIRIWTEKQLFIKNLKQAKGVHMHPFFGLNGHFSGNIASSLHVK